MRGMADWRAVCAGGYHGRSGFSCRARRRVRFHIPLGLLDELVAGVTMDLDRAANGEPDTYATFADLYRYCYLVASVVGLVCIRIFGYTDPRAEKLAEETGIAFQLTNILRDVAEDAERNRVYLPLEDLAAHNVSLDSLLHRTPGAPPTDNERALLAAIARRARGLLLVGPGVIAPDRHREPPSPVGAGFDLSRPVEAHRARGLRCLFAPRQRALATKARHSCCGPGADGFGAIVCMIQSL